MSSKTFNNTKINVEFDEDYQSRTNINSGENISSLFAKIRRFILDLKAVAFSGSYNDLSDVPDVVTKEYVDGATVAIAKKLESERTINGVSFDGTKNIVIPLKRGRVYSNSANIWGKVADIMVTTTNTIRIAEFLVSPMNEPNGYVGILHLHCSVDKNGNIDTKLQWVLCSEYIQPENFVVIANTTDEGTNFELWCKNSSSKGYRGFAFSLLEEKGSFGNLVNGLWNMYITVGQDALPDYSTEDNTTESVIIGIQNTSASAISDENGENISENIAAVKSDIALNRTTLGTQCKNLLNETGYLSSITSVTRGTKSISGNQITLTATAADCYTKPNADSDGGFRISVEPNTDYILSWESDNTYAGLVYVFMNGNTSNYKNANNKVSKYIKFTTNSDTTFITIRLGVSNSGNSITYSNIMLRYADILDDTYEPYQPSVQEQINNFGTQQQLLCDYSSAATSSVTIQITGLFSNYSAVICIVKYSYGRTSITLPLKYIKSIGSSKEYSPISELFFRYIDDNNLFISGADAAISSVKIISLY